MVRREIGEREEESKPHRGHDLETTLALDAETVEEATHEEDILGVLLVVSLGDLGRLGRVKRRVWKGM